MDDINRGNFSILLAAFMEKHELPVRRIARTIGCSVPTLDRLLIGVTYASDVMLREIAVMIELGIERYSKLSKAERKKIAETIGSLSGGTLGFGSVTAAVAALGSAGLSAAGISSGLAALGALVGGGMAAGVTVAAALPLAGVGIGYGIIRAVKYFVGEKQLDAQSFDPKWEMPKGGPGPEDGPGLGLATVK
jgi:hypothetical protein